MAELVSMFSNRKNLNQISIPKSNSEDSIPFLNDEIGESNDLLNDIDSNSPKIRQRTGGHVSNSTESDKSLSQKWSLWRGLDSSYFYGATESHQYEQDESDIWRHHQILRYTNPIKYQTYSYLLLIFA